MSKKLKSFTNTSNGIEVLFYDGWFDSAPRCPHGNVIFQQSLLFANTLHIEIV